MIILGDVYCIGRPIWLLKRFILLLSKSSKIGRLGDEITVRSSRLSLDRRFLPLPVIRPRPESGKAIANRLPRPRKVKNSEGFLPIDIFGMNHGRSRGETRVYREKKAIARPLRIVIEIIVTW